LRLTISTTGGFYGYSFVSPADFQFETSTTSPVSGISRDLGSIPIQNSNDPLLEIAPFDLIKLDNFSVIE
jgi:hypothetical protein